MTLTADLSRSMVHLRTGSRIGSLAVACLVTLTLLPLALAEIPAMVDYPNHLARMSILTRAGTATAHPLYDVVWAPYPNLAMDILVPPLAHWIGIEVATKLFCILALLAVVGGTMTLTAAAGGAVLASGAIASLFVYAMPFAFGFVNFTFALGLALFAMATWLRLADKPLPQRIAAHTLAVAVLYFAHLFALGLYGFTIGIIELWRMSRERPAVGTAVTLVLGMAAPAIVVAVVAGASNGSVGGTGTSWSASAKIFWFGIQNGWSRELSMAITLALAIPLCLASRRGNLRMVGPGPWLAAGFALLFLALPFRLFDTAFVDGRVLIAAILVLPAFMRWTFVSERARKAAWALLGISCLANAGFVTFVQLSYRAEYRSLLSAFEAVPRGSRLLPADRGDGDDPPANLHDYPMYHAATLAVHTRDAFVPTLFTSPGKQPLRAHPSVQHIKLLEGGPIPWRVLQSHADGKIPPDELSYIKNWPQEFDYLLLLHPDGKAPVSSLLEVVATGNRYILYRIRPTGSAMRLPPPSAITRS